jgi:hypothetical protein
MLARDLTLQSAERSNWETLQNPRPDAYRNVVLVVILIFDRFQGRNSQLFEPDRGPLSSQMAVFRVGKSTSLGQTISYFLPVRFPSSYFLVSREGGFQ